MNEVLATEATVQTVSVRIQALMVNNKQMTIAVFRQLPIEQLFDEHLQISPLRFWGRVLYPLDGINAWIVGETDDGALIRCPINSGDMQRSEEKDLVTALPQLFIAV